MATKPANAPVKESIFAAMKKNAAMAKHMQKAKKVVAVREFEGPDGDYPAVLSRQDHYTKDGVLSQVFEFRVLEGEYEGQKLLIFFKFANSDRATITEVQDQFFETLQLMGIETDIDDDELTKQLTSLVTKKTPITLRVKTGKKGGKFTSVVGLAEAAKEIENTEYVEEKTEAATTEEVEEWEDEDAPVDEEEEVVPEEEPVEEESDSALPSAWVGYVMIYKGSEVEVVEADDTKMKCIIKDATGKKLNVAFANLSPPAE